MVAALKRELSGIALLVLTVFAAGSLVLQALPESGSCLDAGGVFGPIGACLRWGLTGLLGAAGAWGLVGSLLLRSLDLFGRLPPQRGRAWTILALGLSVVVPVAIGLAKGAAQDPDRAVAAAGQWGAFAGHFLQRLFGSVGAWGVLVAVASALTAWTVRWNPLRLLLPARRRKEEMAVSPPALDAAPGTAPPEASTQSVVTAKPRARARGGVLGLVERIKTGGAPSFDSGREDFLDTGDFVPPTSLLTAPQSTAVDQGRRELDTMGEKLMEALRTFRVEGELVGRTTGPVVTQYEIQPAPGVKVRQFANLASDLALAMRAPSIRVVAPIPGRGVVGIEVPNPVPEIVWFREIVESREFQESRAALPIALGKDLEGRPVIADLAQMPHLLIAGATGSGKSVCVNTIVTSLIYRHSPETLRFLMIDPKMVELSVYNGLPHLKYKVVTDNSDAATLLKWAKHEMGDRYRLLAANGVRNIQEFNRKVRDGVPLLRPPDSPLGGTAYDAGPLPYIVVVIDELADLMMTVQAEIETPLAILAQKARAIGIHLILATQRPSVNVITGLIKANFPSRIAFRVASQVDSRTIIDGVGAEALLGNGDMLFIPPGRSEPLRIQGAFISGQDTERIMRWFEERRGALREHLRDALAHEEDLLEVARQREALERDGSNDSEGPIQDRDELFRQAAEVCIQHQLGSTSLLQRRLGVGYGRAARIIDQLHAAGVLGPPNGSRPREVLVGLEDLDRICGPATE
jgi:S-DNA-T family DNA segregation ATPase FtsK/SpoIIIE